MGNDDDITVNDVTEKKLRAIRRYFSSIMVWIPSLRCTWLSEWWMALGTRGLRDIEIHAEKYWTI